MSEAEPILRQPSSFIGGRWTPHQAASFDVRNPTAAPSADGHWVSPPLLGDVTPTMRVAGNEIFDPDATLTRFGAEDKVIAIANATAFGLTSAMFTLIHDRVGRVARSFVARSALISVRIQLRGPYA